MNLRSAVWGELDRNALRFRETEYAKRDAANAGTYSQDRELEERMAIGRICRCGRCQCCTDAWKPSGP